MKRGKIFILILTILVIFPLLAPPSVSAVEIVLTKDSYNPQETLQAEITGSFVSLKLNNILIYKQGIPRPMPVISDFIKQEDIYYFYAILPNQEGNYSLVIENSEYTDLGQLKTDEIIKDFTIKRTNQSALQFNPGFILTNKGFFIKVKSLNSDEDANLILEQTGESKDISLVKDIERTVRFSAPKIPGKINLKINSYNIPVFTTQDSQVDLTNPELVFSPSKIQGKIVSGESYFFKVLLENIGDENITNITFSSDLNALIKPSKLDLNINEQEFLNITILVSKEAENNLLGEIKANFGNKSSSLDVSFELVENNTDVDLNGTSYTNKLKCEEIGKECGYDEDCDVGWAPSLDSSLCCKGECVKQKESDYTWIIGVAILVGCFAVIGFFFYKMRKQKSKSTEEILNEKAKKFQEKMKPRLTSSEVSGNLGRS